MKNFHVAELKPDFEESCVAKHFPYSAYHKIEKVESKDPYLIEDDGQMSGFYFFDRRAWTGLNWCHSYDNFSGNVWFGKIYSFYELLQLTKSLSLKERIKELYRSYCCLPTYHSILKYMNINQLSEICIDRFHDFHRVGENDITYDELMAQREEKPENKHVYFKSLR